MKRITVLVSGKVQEVGYRERVVTIAKVFMLTGMVQNLIDGRVRIVAEGEEDKLKSFIDEINIKNTMILVENIDITYSNATGDYADFYKLVGVGETDSRLDTASRYLKELIGVVRPQTDYLKKLIEITQQGFNGMNSKMDIMIDKQNQMLEKQNETISTIQNESKLMIDKQNQMLEKQDIMIEQQTENTNILKEFKEESNRKQDQMIDKQNQMIDKQNQMLEKQDIMIEQQTENTNILKEFKEESNRKQDIMIDNQDQMLEKQTETISAIQNESKLIREEIGGEVNLFNVDSRDHMELNYRDIKEETKEIKEDIRDIKEEIKNIKISLKK